MQRKSTKEILVESFMELSRKKDVNKITIQEIVDNCQYSPATFYRHFSDKYDLIAWELVRYLEADFDDIARGDGTMADYILGTIRYSWNNREYIINLINNTKGYYSYANQVTEHAFALIKTYIEQKYGEKAVTPDLLICLRYSVQGTVHLAFSWIAGEFESTPEHLRDLVYQCLVLTLKPYLDISDF